MSTRWGILWRSENKLDGKREHLMFRNGMPLLFATRRQARDFIRYSYDYLKSRPDLRAEPHGWKMPKPVKVEFTIVK